MGVRSIGDLRKGLTRAVIAVARCGEDTITFGLVDPQLATYLHSLVSSACEVRYVELERECLLSGVKISKKLPYHSPEGCFYVEVAQGTYVGVLPGYIDAQCLVCGDEVRCRLSLQRRAYVRGEVVSVERHIDFKQAREVVEKLRAVEDSLWCIEAEGSLVEIVRL